MCVLLFKVDYSEYVKSICSSVSYMATDSLFCLDKLSIDVSVGIQEAYYCITIDFIFFYIH